MTYVLFLEKWPPSVWRSVSGKHIGNLNRGHKMILGKYIKKPVGPANQYALYNRGPSEYLHTVKTMAVPSFLLLGLLAFVFSFAIAHPQEDLNAEILKRHNSSREIPNFRERCAPSLQARGHVDEAVTRRRGLAQNLRAFRGLPVSSELTPRLHGYEVNI